MNRLSNLILFGKSTDINFRNLSINESFTANYKRNVKNSNNPNIRRKVFDAYSYLRNNFPKAESPTGEIQVFCREVINTFFSKNTTIMRENFSSISDSKLESLAIKVKDLFKRMMGVGNTVLCFDRSETAQPIKVFLDVAYNYDDINKLHPDPLEFKIENGFFKFLNNPDRINISIIINFEYIRSLINKYYNTTELDPQNPSAFEESYTFGNNFYLNINDIIKRFWKDFLGAFTLAIYKDRYREAIYANIYSYFYLLNEEKRRNYQMFYAKTKEEFLAFLTIYRPFIKNMNLEIQPSWNRNSKDWIYPELGNFLWSDFYEQIPIENVNPIDLYNALFEPLQIEISTLRAKLRIYQTLDPETNYTHLDGTIDDLNHTYKDENTNLVVSAILAKRLIPFIIFVETFINKGSKYVEVKNLINRFDIYLTKLSNYASYNMSTKTLDSLITNAKLDKDLLSSSRTILVSSVMVKRIIRSLQSLKDKDIDIWNDTSLDIKLV